MTNDTHPQIEEQSAQTDRKAIVHSSTTYPMTGVVKDGHFHVHDVISHGISARELGAPPSYYPIPLSHIEKVGHRLDYV